MASIFPYSKFRLHLTWKCVYVCVRQRAPVYMNIYTSAWETSYMDILHEIVGQRKNHSQYKHISLFLARAYVEGCAAEGDFKIKFMWNASLPALSSIYFLLPPS